MSSETSTPSTDAVKLCRSVNVVEKAKSTNHTAIQMSTARCARGRAGDEAAVAAADDGETADCSASAAAAERDARLGGMPIQGWQLRVVCAQMRAPKRWASKDNSSRNEPT